MEAKIDNLLSEVKETLRDLFGRRLDRIILFGSYARDDYDKESDIDIMVLVNDHDLAKYDDPILDMIVDLTGKYGIFVSIIVKTKSEFNLYRESSPLLMNVEQEGTDIYAA
jgi:predicted nucleotidyltransferase